MNDEVRNQPVADDLRDVIERVVPGAGAGTVKFLAETAGSRRVAKGRRSAFVNTRIWRPGY